MLAIIVQIRKLENEQPARIACLWFCFMSS